MQTGLALKQSRCEGSNRTEDAQADLCLTEDLKKHVFL